MLAACLLACLRAYCHMAEAGETGTLLPDDDHAKQTGNWCLLLACLLACLLAFCHMAEAGETGTLLPDDNHAKQTGN